MIENLKSQLDDNPSPNPLPVRSRTPPGIGINFDIRAFLGNFQCFGRNPSTIHGWLKNKVYILSRIVHGLQFRFDRAFFNVAHILNRLTKMSPKINWAPLKSKMRSVHYVAHIKGLKFYCSINSVRISKDCAAPVFCFFVCLFFSKFCRK